MPLSRRAFLKASLTGAALACGDPTAPRTRYGSRLSSTPTTPTLSAEPGESAIGLDAPRDGRIYIPVGYDPSRPAPLMLGFHGAGGAGSSWIQAMRPAADAMGVVLLAPDSRARTWDAISGVFDADVEFIDRALKKVFEFVSIDASRMSVAGFSDGATYSLSLGLANGDLFPSVIAFSPGFVVEAPEHGQPAFFIAHGVNDTVLPIDACSRRIVPALRAGGFDVTYNEFDGGHQIIAEQRDNAFAWMLSRTAG